MSDIASLNIKIDSSQARTAQNDLNRLQRQGSATERGMQSMTRTAARLGTALAAAFSFQQIIAQMKASVQAFSNVEQALWRIGRQADLMGHAWANVDYINEFAREMGRATLGSAEDVRQATSLLLTQQDLTRESYEKTIKASLSLAEVTGVNMPTAARYMTRAMTDASGAMTMFQRYGLTFTEQQKDQIKALQDSGQEAEAYAQMLDLMAKRLPDASEGGTTLAHALDTQQERAQELREELGQRLSPAYKHFIEQQTRLTEKAIEFVDTDLDGFIRGIQEVTTQAISPVRTLVAAFTDWVDQIERASNIPIKDTFWDAFLQATPFGRVVREFKNVGDALIDIGNAAIDAEEGMNKYRKEIDRTARHPDLIDETDKSVNNLAGSLGGAAEEASGLDAVFVEIADSIFAMTATESQQRMDAMYQQIDAWREAAGGVNEELEEMIAKWKDLTQSAIIQDALSDALSFQEDYAQATLDTAIAVEGLIEHYRRKTEMLTMSAMEQDIYNAILRMGTNATTEQIQAVTDAIKAYHGLKDELNETADEHDTMMQKMVNATKGWASNFSSQLNDVLWDANRTFDDILESFAKMITQMVIHAKIVEPLLGIAGGFSLFSAKGHAFDQGHVEPFAKGGVVDQPTIFPFARGIGLMGEAGPEAIMPLTRTSDGDLGVKAEVGGGKQDVRIHIHNESGQKMQVTDSKASFDAQGMIIDLWLDGFQRNKHGLRTALGG